ncbi:MAG TPA: hypothetical protein VM452_10090 [Caulifigura sp.]|jgi:acyl carrier protein|nr:hypothetical protein [Caulifigura sp.]
MGLSIVELGMRIEDEFRITIPDEVYGDLKTVGDLHRWVFEQTAAEAVSTDGFCLHPAAFVRIRRALVNVMGVPRGSMRLQTPLSQVIPVTGRIERWMALQRAAGVRFPELRFRKSLARLRATTFLVVLAGLLCWLPFVADPTIAAILAVAPATMVAGMIFLVINDHYFAAFQNQFPEDVQTVADLTVHIANTQRNTLLFSLKQVELNDSERSEVIWQKVKHIVSDVLDRPEADIIPSARFIEDLGAD